MTTLGARIRNYYNFLIYDLADPRTSQWFLVENPFHVILIITIYVFFVTKWGPSIMKNRKPFKLKMIMIAYNIFQIIVNSFIFIEGFRHAYGPYGEYSFWCQPVDTSDSPLAIYANQCSYIYYMVKFLDLLDTIFMVLRKKNSHITFLHVYHHAGMIPLVWGAIKYYPAGHGTFFGIVNCFVHVVMYTYYLLAAIFPPHERHKLGWKKYLTLLQLTQFFILGFHISLPVFQPECQYPKIAAFIVAPQVVFMVILFGDFYRKAYLSTKISHLNGSVKPKLNGVMKVDENKNKVT